MWKESSIKVNGEVFHYWMKQYDKGSEWGIDGGRISNLILKRDGKIICNYTKLKNALVRALLGADFYITDRRYIGFETETGYHHYAIDVAQIYDLEE